MKYTTLRRLQAFGMPKAFLEKLLTYLGKSNLDDEPVSLRTILNANGLDDAIRALSAIDDCPEIRLFAVRCIRESAQPLLTDTRSLDALDVAELYAVDQASDEELDAALEAAWAVVWAADWDAWAATWAARNAAWWATALAAVQAVAWATARDVAWAAVWAADCAARAAALAAYSAGRAAREAQKQDFIDIFCS